MPGALSVFLNLTFLPCPGCGSSLEGAPPAADNPRYARRCPSCSRVSNLNDLVKPYARLTGRLWIFGVVLMAGFVRLEASWRWGFMTAGLAVALWAALRTVRQYRALAAPAV